MNINLQNKVIKDFHIALKDFEPMVKDPEYLWRRRIPNFKLLVREGWANWLVCVVLRKMYDRDITFMEDDVSDGLIVDKEKGVIIPTEHVSALTIPEAEELPTGEQRVIERINLKIDKGPDYARGKILIVFFDGAGKYFRNKIREEILGSHNFEAVFCIGLSNAGNVGYSYYVTEFRDSYEDESITHKVDINEDFTDWEVEQIISHRNLKKWK